MDKNSGYESVWLLYFLAFVATCPNAAASVKDASLHTYIVHTFASQMPPSFDNPQRWHSSLVNSLHGLDEADGSQYILYNYNQVLHGFAAQLTPAQAEALEKTEAILAVRPETVYHLDTTRTPHFLGLDAKNGVWSSQSNNSHDIVVGLLDTGVWPESASFSDRGMKAVPSHWKGRCESGTAFNASHCNKKLIGARFFCKGYEASRGQRVDEDGDYRSPRDGDGHGTHTASTAAGSPVNNANIFGFASGTAVGMAPAARVAVYKVCWSRGCESSDILAGMERAVKDGVNILSLSIGGSHSADYATNEIALGAFAAMQRGIFVSCSAGNAGPDARTVNNVAPWVTTVGASTVDRSFPATLVLGNGVRYSGVSLYRGQALPRGKLFPLIYAPDGSTLSHLCREETLDPPLVEGKIVVCDTGSISNVEKSYMVKSAGGVGIILANKEGETLGATSDFLPAVTVGFKTGQLIKNYIKASRAPTATIESTGLTIVATKPAPVVATFSSRGPNSATPQILKPDIIAPGVNILAAWTGAAGPSNLEIDTRKVKFNIISGTSMACPHVSGIAAVIKGAHPDWSPAAIRSALVTTAYTLDNTGKPLSDGSTQGDSTPFAHGAGHVKPIQALAPGLVYDMGVHFYVDFLCALSYTPRQMRTITKSNATCSKEALRNRDPGSINYPSFSAVFAVSNSTQVLKYRRTVTNVGNGASKYRVAVSAPAGVSIVVKPTTLSFQKRNEKRSYSVTFMAMNLTASSSLPPNYGSITWSDGVHNVTSPVAAFSLTS